MRFDAIFEEIKRGTYFEALNKIYEAIPGGECSGCARCCYDAVETSFMEYMQIKAFLINHKMLGEGFVEPFRNFVRNELSQVNACPFLISDRCQIYPVRPLTCRLFGYQSKSEQKKRRALLLASHQAISLSIKNEYGYDVPKSVEDHVISYCADFVPFQKMSRQKRGNLYDSLMALDSHFYMEGKVDAQYMQMTLVDWILQDFKIWQDVQFDKLEAVQSLVLDSSNKTK